MRAESQSEFPNEETILGIESTFLGRETTFLGCPILTNSTFAIWEFLGCSLVLLWFLLGLLPEGDREGTKEQNLNKSAFLW